MNDENIIITVPEYLFESDNVDFDFDAGSFTRNEVSNEALRDGSELGSQEEDFESNDDDVILILNDILTDSDSSTAALESLVIQVDNLNDNINTLNENVKVGVSVLFVLLVFTLIKIVSAVLNKILGLGTC